MDYQERARKVGEWLPDAGLGAVLLKSPADINYLTGFTGSSATLLVLPNGHTMIATDGRYFEQLKEESPETELLPFVRGKHLSHADVFAESWPENAAKPLGFQKKDFSVQEFELYSKKLAKPPTPCEVPVSDLRMVKDNQEIGLLKKVADVADTALKESLSYFSVGVSEREFASELEFRMRKHGADGASFPTIVASGPNGSLPHASCGDRKIAEGELVTIDFGARKDGYCSDMTRTFWLGSLDEESRSIYQSVLKAYTKAMTAVAPGLAAKELDKIARDVLAEDGYAEYFVHSLGHGIGIEVHEKPGLSASSIHTLETGQVFTIEPGVYLPERTGCRLENSFALEAEGLVCLSSVPFQAIDHTHPKDILG